mmetsp:Transcript_46300/g.115179  ORF Transcript_46300/g.115179 Transcript_46300/m.115179 type:complete len:341 (-) Transcript_46300:13-1035(-)
MLAKEHVGDSPALRPRQPCHDECVRQVDLSCGVEWPAGEGDDCEGEGLVGWHFAADRVELVEDGAVGPGPLHPVAHKPHWCGVEDVAKVLGVCFLGKAHDGGIERALLIKGLGDVCRRAGENRLAASLRHNTFHTAKNGVCLAAEALVADASGPLPLDRPPSTLVLYRVAPVAGHQHPAVIPQRQGRPTSAPTLVLQQHQRLAHGLASHVAMSGAAHILAKSPHTRWWADGQLDGCIFGQEDEAQERLDAEDALDGVVYALLWNFSPLDGLECVGVEVPPDAPVWCHEHVDARVDGGVAVGQLTRLYGLPAVPVSNDEPHEVHLCLEDVGDQVLVAPQGG